MKPEPAAKRLSPATRRHNRAALLRRQAHHNETGVLKGIGVYCMMVVSILLLLAACYYRLHRS